MPKLICRCEKCKRKLIVSRVTLKCVYCGGDVYALKALNRQ